MPSLPQETPQQDVRNAAMILQNCGVWSHDMEDSEYVTFEKEDFAAIMDRLTVAIVKLESRQPVTPLPGGINHDPA